MIHRILARRWPLISVLLFSAAGFGWGFFLYEKSGSLPSLSDDYHIEVALPTAGTLTSKARVTAAGVRVGTVESVRRRGAGAVARLRIDDGRVRPLPADSRVELRQATPLAENYIAIEVGEAERTLPDGAVLPVEHTGEYVELDEILSVLQGRTRERARRTLQGLERGVGGRGAELNRLVGDGSEFVHSGSDVLDVLHRDRAAVARLVDQLGRVASAVGERGAAIRTLATRGQAAFAALRDADDSLEALLRELPGSLESVRSTGSVIERVSARTTGTVAKLARAVDELRPAVHRLRPGADSARAVLSRLDDAAPELQQVLRQATAAGDPVPELLPEVHRVICEVAPMVRYAKPYFPDVLGLILGLGSGSNSYDATGHVVRLAPIVNDNTLSGLPDPVLRATSILLNGGILSELNARNYNFYMKPGEIARVRATGNFPMGPEDMPKTGFVYPRVTEDCQ